MDSSSSSQQNQYPYPASQQSYNPSRFRAYDPQSYYQYQQDPHRQQQQQTFYHHQQQQQQQYHQQPQQQYSSYYTPNYSNSYPLQHPQAHQQWNHQDPPIHPPGVSIQPSSASHGQPHFQLPNQQNGYHLPQRTDGIGLGLAGSVGAAERLTGGVHGQSWYPQAQGFGPVIGGPGTYTGPGLGSGAFTGNGAAPSGLRTHAGQSLDKGDGRRRGGDRRRGVGQSKGGDRRRGGGQNKGGGRRRGDGQSKGGDRRRGDGQSKGGDRRRGDGQSKGGGKGKVSNSAGVGRCDLCNVDCGCLGILKMHLNGKRHKRNLEKLEANENRTVSDFENVQKPSGDLEPGTAMKPDNLLVEEETKQNPPQNIPLTAMMKPDNLLVEEETKQNPPQNIPLTAMMKPDNLLVEEEIKQNPPQNIPLTAMKPDDLLVEEDTKQNPQQSIPLTAMKPDDLLVEEETKQYPPQNIPLTDMKPDNLLVEEETKQNPPQNIPLDTVSSENKETEQKINNAQEADPLEDANRDLLEKKPMMNQSGNQKSGVKRKILVGGRKKKKVSKAKKLTIEPSKSEVVIPLMCNLCNVQCGTREILRQHLLDRQHMSALKCVEGHHPIYGQAGLQAIYPHNPVTNSLYYSQGAQQVLNGAQVSDPIAGASLLPQNENAAPSVTGVLSDSQQNSNPQVGNFVPESSPLDCIY